MNILFIFLHPLVSKFVRFKAPKEEQDKNMSFIVVIEDASILDKSIETMDEHSLNIRLLFFNFVSQTMVIVFGPSCVKLILVMLPKSSGLSFK